MASWNQEEPTKEPQEFQGDLTRQHFPNADKKYNSIRTYSIKPLYKNQHGIETRINVRIDK